MTFIPTDHVLRLLRAAPAGLTTREVAEKIGHPNLASVGSKLSKLAFYGEIDRELRRGQAIGHPHRWFIWKAKPKPAWLTNPIDQQIQGLAYDA